MNAIVLTDRLDAAPVAPSKPILSIEDLNVRFGSVVAIESLSLTVRRGEFVSLLGPSGCGKSTLLKAIAGLVKPAGGQITRSDADLRTGFMFQKPLLLPWRTTLDNVLLPVEIQRGGNAVDPADRRNALRMLDLVRLGDFARAYPHQLSGGMQQRAALARALMCDPDVLSARRAVRRARRAHPRRAQRGTDPHLAEQGDAADHGADGDAFDPGGGHHVGPRHRAVEPAGAADRRRGRRHARGRARPKTPIPAPIIRRIRAMVRSGR